MLVLHRVYAAIQLENFDSGFHLRQLQEEIERLQSVFYTLASVPLMLKHYAEVETIQKQNRYVKSDEENRLDNILQNEVIKILEEHSGFQFKVKKNRYSWEYYPDLAKSFFEKIKTSSVFEQYISIPKKGFGEDKQFLINLFTEIKNAPAVNADENVAGETKEWIENNTLRNFYDDILEEIAPNWYEIKVPVNVSLIKMFQAIKPEDDSFMAVTRDEEGEISLSERILKSVLLHLEEIEKALSGILQNWDITRVSVVDRALMYMASAEMLFMPDIPARVTLNEYLELAKSYSSPESKSFINGILDKVMKESGKTA